MLRSRYRLMLIAGAVAACSLLPAGPASAALTAVANWQMNEEPGATTMGDRSGNKTTGRIGDQVDVGGGDYTFAAHTGTTPSRRVVTVPDKDSLDPGTAHFVVSLRFRTSARDGNLIQKGQSGIAGGFWKVEVHEGRMTCHFRDAAGNTAAVRTVGQVTDGAWHTARCERTASGVSLTVDGVRTARTDAIGTVSNGAVVAIGGKLKCNWGSVGCDPFVGALDWVVVRRG